MNEAFLITAEELAAWGMIDSAESIMITSHVHPDGDAVGSVLAMKHYCKEKGKEASVVIDDDIPEAYHILEGARYIEKPSGNIKNDVDLLIIMDTNPGRIGRCSEINAKITLNIDHHDTNQRLCDYHIIRGSISSTSELLYQIICYEGFRLKPDIVDCLYMGIVTDTVFFKSAAVTGDTFRTTARLVECGARHTVIAEAIGKKSLEETVLSSRALSLLRTHRNGTVAGVTLDEVFDALELTDSVIDAIRNVRGVSIAYLLKHEKDGSYRVRMRSGTYDLTSFAREHGGGGHSYAAGFTIQNRDTAGAELYFITELYRWLEQYSG